MMAGRGGERRWHGPRPDKDTTDRISGFPIKINFPKVSHSPPDNSGGAFLFAGAWPCSAGFGYTVPARHFWSRRGKDMHMPYSFPWTGLVTLIAVIVYGWTGIRVARARAKYDVKAPATAGHPDFDRVFRVQANTGGADCSIPALPVAVRGLIRRPLGRRDRHRLADRPCRLCDRLFQGGREKRPRLRPYHAAYHGPCDRRALRYRATPHLTLLDRRGTTVNSVEFRLP